MLNALESLGRGKPVGVVFFDAVTEQETLDTNGVREPDSSRAGVKGPKMAKFI